jgi:hypothetical protein
MKQYLAMWDMYGLEFIFETSKWEKEYMWSILSEKPKPTTPSIQMMILRAKANSQRCYEIYSFNADDDLTEESIKLAFETAPQGIVDFIRANGQKIYSDRATQKAVII